MNEIVCLMFASHCVMLAMIGCYLVYFWVWFDPVLGKLRV